MAEVLRATAQVIRQIPSNGDWCERARINVTGPRRSSQERGARGRAVVCTRRWTTSSGCMSVLAWGRYVPGALLARPLGRLFVTGPSASPNLPVQAALRAATADFLWQHALEFQPFFTNDDGDPMTIGPSSVPPFPCSVPRAQLTLWATCPWPPGSGSGL